jgi:hypothetical protein
MIPSNISLQPHETLRGGLLRVVDLLIDSVIDVPSHHSWNAEQDIHEVRTTIKRLRALLRLIRLVIDPGIGTSVEEIQPTDGKHRLGGGLS